MQLSSVRYANFDTFSTAVLSVFIILIGEDWQWVMYDAILSLGDTVVFVFVFIFVVGNLILLNLFLALLLGNFSSADIDQVAKRETIRNQNRNLWIVIAMESAGLNKTDKMLLKKWYI